MSGPYESWSTILEGRTFVFCACAAGSERTLTAAIRKISHLKRQKALLKVPNMLLSRRLLPPAADLDGGSQGTAR